MENRLLITKNGALGDVIVSTAAMQELCLRDEFTDVQICGPLMLTELLSASLWTKISAIWVIDAGYSQVFEYLPTGSAWEKSGRSLSYFQLLGEFQAIANLRYESLRFILPAFFRGLVRIGSSSFWSGFLYNYRAPWLGLDPLIHERDRHLQVISAYPGFSELVLAWQEKGLPPLAEKNESVLSAYGLSGKYILVNPTASERFKAWPAPRFRELLSRLAPEAEKLGLRVVVIGAPNETNWLKEVNPDFIQPRSLKDLVQIVGGSKLLIANASSMHFIASSFEVPTFVLMGGAKVEVWGPLGKFSTFLKGKSDEFSKTGTERELSAFASLSVENVYRELLSKLVKIS
jgi:ADP-heptose:LPS heptosyltransferase